MEGIFTEFVGSRVRKNRDPCSERFTVPGSFQLLYWRLDPSDSYIVETQGWYDFIYLSKGLINVKIGKKTYALKSGSSIVLPPHTKCQISNASKKDPAMWFSVSNGSRDTTEESFESE